MSTATVGEFTCLICELDFLTEGGLRHHFRICHRKRKLVVCGFCKMMFIKKKTCHELCDDIWSRRSRYIDQLGAVYSRKKDLCSSSAVPVATADGPTDEVTVVEPGSTSSTIPTMDST